VVAFERAFKRLDQFVEQKIKANNIPGMAIALTDREKLLRVSTYGHADVAAKQPVTPDTLFEIGSISKSFTSLAVLQLWEEGRLDLHEPVSRYLPWFEIQSQYEPITLHHLMSHTAGIIRGAVFLGDPRFEVWALRETEVAAPPGTYYHYSNAGYKTLGVVVEEVGGQPFGDIIQERLLGPLEMAATDPIITHETRKRLAVGYEAFYDDRPPAPGRPFATATWLEYTAADGSIASTPADMAAFMRMLMNRGRGPRGRIVSEESFGLMTRRVIAAEEEGRDCFYGYGLEILDSDGCTYIGHGGGMVGYYSWMLVDMSNGLGVIVLMNGPGNRSDEEIARFALRLLRATLYDQELPAVPLIGPSRVENAAEYAGTYRACAGPGREADADILTLVAEGEQLVLYYGNEPIALELRGADRFYADHPDFSLFLLRFGREKGEVVEAFHGPRWYTSQRYTGPKAFEHPQAWEAYSGHYRSHNPELSDFRIVLRKGAATLIHAWGDEEPLVPLGGGVFRVGEDARSPERIRFDTIVDGQALRANLSCGNYYRKGGALGLSRGGERFTALPYQPNCRNRLPPKGSIFCRSRSGS
jgi:CubicO group peptidase (beta-lactamase class C family)